MKHFFRYATCILLAILLFSSIPFASAAEEDRDGLPIIRDFEDAGFTDVAEDWSRSGIEGAYELGLMEGTGAGTFEPDKTVSLAEAIAAAAKVHDLWTGGDGIMNFTESASYDAAVEYAINAGIISANQFPDYTAAATRGEVAAILARTLPEDTYRTLNRIVSLPDVTVLTPYCSEIFTLYKSGILAGTDAYGTFKPDSSITRKEIAAILCHLAQPARRSYFQLKPVPLKDTTAYSTNRSLILNGIAIPGIAEIGGEPFIPGDSLGLSIDGGAVPVGCFFLEDQPFYLDPETNSPIYDESSFQYELEFGSGPFKADSYRYGIADTVSLPVVRWPIGNAASSGRPLIFSHMVDWDDIPQRSTHTDFLEDEISRYLWYLLYGYYPEQKEEPTDPAELKKPQYVEDELEDAVYLLDGMYPLIRLSSLGIPDTGGDIIWNTGEIEVPAEQEEDLVGEALQGLIRSDARETVKAIHDYIATTVTYDPFATIRIDRGSPDVSSTDTQDLLDAYTAAMEQFKLLTNITIAAGYGGSDQYAGLFCDMCIRAGIPCRYLTGHAAGSREGGHAWNAVYIDNEWLYVDCTFDSINRPDSSSDLLYDYFLVDADSIGKDRIWWGDDCPTPKRYDSAWEQIDSSNITTADEFRKCTAAQVHLGKTSFTLTVATPDAYGGPAAIFASNSWYNKPIASYTEQSDGNVYTYTVEYK